MAAFGWGLRSDVEIAGKLEQDPIRKQLDPHHTGVRMEAEGGRRGQRWRRGADPPLCSVCVCVFVPVCACASVEKPLPLKASERVRARPETFF